MEDSGPSSPAGATQDPESRAEHAPAPSIDLETYFDRVVVINLDRRPDRWERLQRHLEEIAWPFRAPTRVSAVDGQRCTPPSWWRPSKGAWGCQQSKLAVLNAARRDGVERLLVLEDDVVFLPDLHERARRFLGALPGEWDQLYFGGQHRVLRGPAWTPVNDEVVRPINVIRTHAWAASRDFLRVLLEHLDDLRGHSSWPKFHSDHRIGQLHADPRYRIYAPPVWFAGQYEGYSDIQSQMRPTHFWQRERG